MIKLGQKVAAITGGSRGIGAAIAVLLAQAGADIAFCYQNRDECAEQTAASIRALGRRVWVYKGDISQTATTKKFIETTLQQLGKLDILVTNAAIWTHGVIGSMPEEVWDETMAVNLRGVFNVTNAAVPYLKQNQGSSIVMISSTAGQRGEARHSHYAASKGAILALMKSLALELAPDRIRVNAVAPGWVDTELNATVFCDPDFIARITNEIPLQRIASAEDVAGSVLFLSSELARHITGATINVNGGSLLI